MIKRRLLTSVVGSLVLAVIWVGCGSSNGNCCSGGLKPGTEAKGSIAPVESGTKNSFVLIGETGDATGEAASARILKTYDSDGNQVCQTIAENCSCDIVLEATTCSARVEADDKYIKEDGLAVLAHVLANSTAYNYDITEDMVVYGGTMLPTISGFCKSDLKIDVKGMKCGQAIKLDGTTVQAGFANPGHTVFAMITIDGKEPQFTAISDTMDADGNFTIDLTGIDLCGDNVEVSLFSIKKANRAGTTGGSK